MKDPKTLFLINNETNSFSSLENNLKENEFFVNLISQIVSEIHFINVSDPDSYEIFLQSLNDILITKKSQFLEVKNNFNLISSFKTSSAYASIRFNESNWKIFLKDLVSKRKTELESYFNNDESFLIMISNLSHELHQITPSFDIEFLNECNSILSDYKTLKYRKNREFYSLELQKSAESHLSFLNERINQKYFWNEEQIDMIKKSHYIFLKNEFFDILQLTNTEKTIGIVYDANIDLLKKQIDESNNKIVQILEPFVSKINKKSI